MEYEIIDRSEMGEQLRRRGKWIAIFDPLEVGKVVKFKCDNHQKVESLRRTILQTFRKDRRPYRLHTRILSKDGVVNLYVWKEEK